jgi:hypothetical protein
MNDKYFSHSGIAKAYKLEREQPFGKNNVNQSYTADKAFVHVTFLLLKSDYLSNRDLRSLLKADTNINKLWKTWLRVKRFKIKDFRKLQQLRPDWNKQEQIDPYRVDLRMALLLHYNFDLAAVHRFIGGNHTAAHMDPDIILPRIRNDIDDKTYNDLERVLRMGCPAHYNVHGTRLNYLKYRAYGNHNSVKQNTERALAVMNKDDKRDFVLTIPTWVVDFIPDAHVNPQALIMIPGKKDRLVFNSSYMIDADSRPYNIDCDSSLEPDIFFGTTWIRHLTNIFNIRISFPGGEIFLMDDDVTAAFKWAKYNPNIISAKIFTIGKLSFVCTGQCFGDVPSPANFEPLAQAITKLATRLSVGDSKIPLYPKFMNAVTFAPPPPPNTVFVSALPDKFNKGVLANDRSLLPAQYNMYVDDKLMAALGEARMRFIMRCSIHATFMILGEPDANRGPDAIDFDKFVRDTISHERTQLGYRINTRTLEVTIPEEKLQAMLELLQTTWGPRRRSFTLREAAELLGTLLSFCRACKWGIFLFTNLLKALHEALNKNAQRLMRSEEFRLLTHEAGRHPTDSAKFKFFASKVARTIWDSKEKTWLNKLVKDEISFLVSILSNEYTCRWSAPIAHLIQREQHYEIFQDACLTGAGGFSIQLLFWWALEWPDIIALRTIRYLRKGDVCMISINLLEYAAIIISLAGAILIYEALPTDARPNHPISLLWTDNTSAASWTKKVAGLKGYQGKALARIFAHLLMFSDMGVNAEHIKGDLNDVADFLSRIRETDDYSQFSYASLVQKYPQLRNSRRFQPSPELLSLIFTALSTGSPTIPQTRVKLGQMVAE